jgi:hypothetical protein
MVASAWIFTAPASMRILPQEMASSVRALCHKPKV